VKSVGVRSLAFSQVFGGVWSYDRIAFSQVGVWPYDRTTFSQVSTFLPNARFN
jgi:hypothetical protein